MKRKKSLSILALLLVLTLILSACAGGGQATAPASGNEPEAKAESGTIKFAVVGPMTGDNAAWGLHEKKGVETAVEEINAAGGINGKKLEFIIGDDQGNPNQATVLAQKIVSDKDLLFVIGSVGSGCTLAALPTYEKAGIGMISPSSTNPTLCDQGFSNFFRIIPNDNEGVRQQVLLAIKELGATKPAIIWENTDYGLGCHDVAMEVLKELGVEPVGDESYVSGVDRDFSAQVTKFKGAGADLLLIMGDYTAAALIAQQNVSLGLNAKVVGSAGCASFKLMEIGGKATEGFWVNSAFDPNDQREKQAAFTKLFKEKYNEDPAEWSSHAYDVVYVCKAAYELGGTTRETFIKKMFDVKYDGVTGHIEFAANGDVTGKTLSVMTVKDGKFVTYIPTKF